MNSTARAAEAHSFPAWHRRKTPALPPDRSFLGRHRHQLRWRLLHVLTALLCLLAWPTLSAAQPSLQQAPGIASFGALADTATIDSIAYTADRFSYDADSNAMTLRGNAQIRYGTMTLTAERIRFLTEQNLVIAEGVPSETIPDSVVGRPRFSDGSGWFTGERFVYNIRTRKGTVEGGYHEAPEGIYSGRRIKRTGEKQVDVREGVYTTCENEHPHYEFKASKMRVIIGDKVIARPVVLKVADVPMFWFPFGVFFIDKDRRSGFLAPRMGERAYTGRFMNGLGYYLAPNDYFGAQGVLNMDERIGYDWRLRSDYAVRYMLSGSVSSQYSKRWGAAGTSVWTLSAQHRQQITPRSTLSANVNYTSTSTPNRTAGSTTADQLTQVYNSTLGYAQTWESGYSFRAEMSRSQNLQKRSMSQRVPTVSISSGTQFFFKEPERLGPRARVSAPSQEWYRRLTYSWSWSGTNSGYRAPRSSYTGLFDTWYLEEDQGDSVVTYMLTITARAATHVDDDDGTYRLDKDGDLILEGRVRLTDDDDRLTLLSYSAGYDSGWVQRLDDDRIQLNEPTLAAITTWRRYREPSQYTRTTSQSVTLGLPLPTPRWLNLTPSLGWSASWTNRPDEDDLDDPNTTHNVNAGISSSATFYGLFPVGLGPLAGLRHVITPSASARISISRQTRGGNYILGGTHVGGDTSRTVDLGLRNVLQAKLNIAGAEHRFDRLLTVSTGVRYNHDATSRRWSDPSTSITVYPSDNVNSTVSMTHSFYDDDDVFRRRMPTLRTMSVNTSIRLAGGGEAPSEAGEEGYGSQSTTAVDERGLDRLQQTTGQTQTRVTRDTGWRVNLRHTYSWRRGTPGSVITPVPVHQVDVNGSFSPYRDWFVEASTHYDIQKRMRDGDTINITRRLHCWQAQLRWVLKGSGKGYYFLIHVIDLPDVKVETASESYR